MVQIGDIHIGRAAAAGNPQVSLGEAHILWDFLLARYRCIEETQIRQHLAHDPDFKFFIAREMNNTLERQANELEKELNRIGLPLPKRPPKYVSDAVVSPDLFTDEYLFNQLYIGCGNYFEQLVYAIRGFRNNDTLRKRFMQYLEREMEIYDNLIKFGKVKGWLNVPPMYNPH